ncbi:Cellobiose phosphorylase [Anaerohalosphaera lusitana]|uniref:Cellobiose phosphorylase n=2 Tax=Anaerohalosphaera lusitana TaxID=1936003 RepID=A0A1U9NKR7_9BACT|nr:Cellobiose phosphorylase [Anaerohalosphaera lusitana]
MKYGYFDEKNREYVIDRCDVPVSFTNYLGLENMCTVISHNSGGYSFKGSPEYGRITRFRPNGVPLDRPGHYVYLRDDETGKYWTVSWQPVGIDLKEAEYVCRHGLSYSKFECKYNGIIAEKTLFVPLGHDVELWDVKVTNTSDRKRAISLFSYVEFSLHQIDLDNKDFQMGLYASGSSCTEGVIDYTFFYHPDMHHFMTADFEPDSYDCVRDEFIGNYRSESNPAAVENGRCSNSSKLGGNHCGSLHKQFEIEPGQTIRAVLMLGAGGAEQGKKTRKMFADHSVVDKAFEQIKNYWRSRLANYQCITPDEGANVMLNTWTPYQAATCVTWSRFASFIEVGGRTGLGYRDTAQDTISSSYLQPDKVKQRLVELMRAQTSEGFGLHLFDPAMMDESGDAKANLPTVLLSGDSDQSVHIPELKDVCSDDALWLVAAVCEYLKETGDIDFLETEVTFADEGSATVYEHLKKALDFSAKHVADNGICQGLRADWNDCINLRGGQSSMVTFMHYWALRLFNEVAAYLNRDDDSERYSEIASRIKQAAAANLWDGQWYLRGFTAEGRKIGTDEDEEGKLFLNAQSWAVMSGLSEHDKAIRAMDAAYDKLFDRYGLHLLWPAYSKPDDGVGFVTRVYKGIKENASIFSHPNPWAIIAECMLGRGDRAFEYYTAMLPFYQNDMMEIRQAEPYSYCQFVMGKDHTDHGRARHPWLTGSAGWFYTAATKWILGVRPTFKGLEVDPCVPKDWDEFSIVRKWRGSTFNISVKNPDHVSKGVKSIKLNGQEITGLIPVQQPGTDNDVQVLMG